MRTFFGMLKKKLKNYFLQFFTYEIITPLWKIIFKGWVEHAHYFTIQIKLIKHHILPLKFFCKMKSIGLL